MLLLAVRGAACAQDASPGRIWSVTFVRGEVTLRRVTTHIVGQLQSSGRSVTLTFTAIERQQVKDISARGDATVVRSVVSMDAVVDGQSVRLDGVRYPTITRVYNRQGILTRETPEPRGDQSAVLVAGRLTANRPTPPGPVRVGMQWRNQLDTGLRSPRRAAMTSTLLLADKRPGVDTLRVGFTLELRVDPQTAQEAIRALGTQETDLLTGRLLRSQTTLANVVLDTPAGRMQGEVNIQEELLSPQPKEAVDAIPSGNLPKIN